MCKLSPETSIKLEAGKATAIKEIEELLRPSTGFMIICAAITENGTRNGGLCISGGTLDREDVQIFMRRARALEAHTRKKIGAAEKTQQPQTQETIQ